MRKPKIAAAATALPFVVPIDQCRHLDWLYERQRARAELLDTVNSFITRQAEEDQAAFTNFWRRCRTEYGLNTDENLSLKGAGGSYVIDRVMKKDPTA